MPTVKKHLNASQRNLVVDLINQGSSYRKVEEMTGISFATVQSIYKKFKTHGTTADLVGRGRKRKTSSTMDRAILLNVKKNRFVSAIKIANDLKSNHGVKISDQTVRNRIHEAGFKAMMPIKKPYLTKKHMKRRLEFAKKYANMPMTFWKKVLWSDESKFNLKASDGIQRVWRKPDEAYKLSCMRATVKFGGGNIMVWGAMAWRGVGKLEFIDDRMNADMYIDIIRRNLKASARKLRLGSSFIFQQDNDPKHTAKKTSAFFEENHINVLEWPAQSPDLNPIEHLWALLDNEIGERSFTKKDDLKTAVTNAWGKIDAQKIKNLVESMPRRLAAVIKAKGGPTKY